MYLDSRYLRRYIPISIFEGFLSTFTLYGFQGTSNIDSYIELLRFISFHFKKESTVEFLYLKTWTRKYQDKRGEAGANIHHIHQYLFRRRSDKS